MQHTKRIKGLPLFLLAVSLFLFPTATLSQVLNKATLHREYEPVVTGATIFPDFLGTPINQLHLYVYHSDKGTWEPIPFQIDEVGEDKFFAGDDGLFDADTLKVDELEIPAVDELVFMAKDLGDQVTPGNWISDAESRSFNRYEIMVIDSLDGTKGWCYLYKSSTITEKSPVDYVSYDSTADKVNSLYYELGYNANGVPVDLKITSLGGGNGQDILDRQKQRFKGWITTFSFEINEDSLRKKDIDHIDESVRVIRRIYADVVGGGVVLKENIPQTARLYPYSLDLRGTVPPILLPGINVTLLRQSWDYNEKASGMVFHNRNNQNVPIDGVTDPSLMKIGGGTPEDSLLRDEVNWFMVTGSPGTVVTIADLSEIGYSQRLYYWDKASGGSKDETEDTGDKKSYGDTGIMILGEDIEDTLVFKSTIYLLPANQPYELGNTLLEYFKNPLAIYTYSQSYAAGVKSDQETGWPNSFRLWPNYPNPFNPETHIVFELPTSEKVTLQIVNTVGKHVITLVDQKLEPGIHEYRWNGRDQQGRTVPSGIYFCSVETKSFKAVRKMTLIQ